MKTTAIKQKTGMPPASRRRFIGGALAFTGLIFVPKFVARAASSNIKRAFASPASITCTLASLASTSARESNSVDNTTNLYLDAMLRLDIKLQTGTPGLDKAISVWFAGSEDGTNFTDNATGSDAAISIRTPTNLRGPFIINTPDSGGLTYKAVIPSVASFFGGVLPKKWNFVVLNRTNIAFSSTEGDHTKEYSGVYLTAS